MFPLFFNFEESSYESIGLKFACLTFIGMVCVGVTSWLMIETDGMSRDQVRMELTNSKGKKENISLLETKSARPGFVELLEDEGPLGGDKGV